MSIGAGRPVIAWDEVRDGEGPAHH